MTNTTGAAWAARVEELEASRRRARIRQDMARRLSIKFRDDVSRLHTLAHWARLRGVETGEMKWFDISRRVACMATASRVTSQDFAAEGSR